MKAALEAGRAGRRLAGTVLAVWAACSGAIVSRAAAQDTGLPAAKDLVDRHVKAVHADKLINEGSMRTISEFTMGSLGTAGEIVAAGAAPARVALHMTLPGLGEISSGYNGEVGWSMNPMEGPRLLSGPELAQARDEADFDSNLRGPSVVDSMRTLERTEVDGHDCWKVRLVWKSGRETFDCYDVDSGYLVATMLTTQTAMGSIEAVITFDDYTDYDGIMLPRTTRQRAFGQEMTVRLKSVEFGNVADSVFALPEAVRALVGK